MAFLSAGYSSVGQHGHGLHFGSEEHLLNMCSIERHEKPIADQNIDRLDMSGITLCAPTT